MLEENLLFDPWRVGDAIGFNILRQIVLPTGFTVTFVIKESAHEEHVLIIGLDGPGEIAEYSIVAKE